ncbi:hypothetical protein K0M31_013974 [Melipona bicolor]|uniref:Uncharacterized protein n=1 Tax=Melipona bicolor TaxID=60889 RepID=A0AA40G7M3_9HYME|nr:hypothetical protein K0M31_013974 [Melipona bicolor]
MFLVSSKTYEIRIYTGFDPISGLYSCPAPEAIERGGMVSRSPLSSATVWLKNLGISRGWKLENSRTGRLKSLNVRLMENLDMKKFEDFDDKTNMEALHLDTLKLLKILKIQQVRNLNFRFKNSLNLTFQYQKIRGSKYL